MRLELIESDFNYYKISNKYNYDIKSYANEYELLTFYYLKYNYRKFIEKYNNINTLSSRKISPIQVGMKFNYLGYTEIYFIDTSNFLPKNKDIAIIQIIGPGEIKDGTLYLYDDLEKVLNKYNNKTHSIYYYYNWDTNNKYHKIESNKINMKYNVFDKNIITNKIKKKIMCIV